MVELLHTRRGDFSVAPRIDGDTAEEKVRKIVRHPAERS